MVCIVEQTSFVPDFLINRSSSCMIFCTWISSKRFIALVDRNPGFVIFSNWRKKLNCPSGRIWSTRNIWGIFTGVLIFFAELRQKVMCWVFFFRFFISSIWIGDSVVHNWIIMSSVRDERLGGLNVWNLIISWSFHNSIKYVLRLFSEWVSLRSFHLIKE